MAGQIFLSSAGPEGSDRMIRLGRILPRAPAGSRRLTGTWTRLQRGAASQRQLGLESPAALQMARWGMAAKESILDSLAMLPERTVGPLHECKIPPGGPGTR